MQPLLNKIPLFIFHYIIFKYKVVYTLIERKSSMPQLRGIEGEAVVVYCEPLITKGMGWIALCIADIVSLQQLTNWECRSQFANKWGMLANHLQKEKKENSWERNTPWTTEWSC